MLNQNILAQAFASKEAKAAAELSTKKAEEAFNLNWLALCNEVDQHMKDKWGFHIGLPYNIHYVRHPTGVPEVSTNQRTYTSRGGYAFLEHLSRTRNGLSPNGLLHSQHKGDFDKDLTDWAKKLSKGMVLNDICDITAGRDAKFSTDCPAFVRRDSGEYELFTVHRKEVDGKPQPFFRIFLFADWDTLVGGIAAYQRHGVDHEAFKGTELNLSPEDLMQRFPFND